MSPHPLKPAAPISMPRARLVLWLVIAAFSSSGCGPSSPQPPPSESPDGEPEARELSLRSLPEDYPVGGLLSGPEPSFRDLLARLQAVARDEDAKGLFLRFGAFQGGMGRSEELAQALQEVREAGKPIHCHAEQLDNLALWVAANGCDQLSLTPAGEVEFVGLALQLFYVKRLLDRIGVQADLMQVGDYKGARDPFTEETLPATTAESLNLLLDDLQAWLVKGVAEGRSIPETQVNQALEEGPLTGDRALALGLIDRLAFLDEARQQLRDAAKVSRLRAIPISGVPPPTGIVDILEALTGGGDSQQQDAPRVVVASIHGTILDGERTSEGATASGPFVRAMKTFRDDDQVRAVVVRINSPGGSALASDRMWHALHLLAKKKPVVVSVGDMAASGGYYIASASSEIFSPEGALVGSIGVVGGKMVVADVADELGINLEVLKRGPHAAYASPHAPFSDEERAVLARAMQQTYRRFLRRIKKGRNMDPIKLNPQAEGRIWSGQRALAGGLVDRKGGLVDALARARELGKLPRYAPVEHWPGRRSPLDVLTESFGEEQIETAHRLLAGLGHTLLRNPQVLLTTALLLQQESTLTLLPFLVEIH